MNKYVILNYDGNKKYIIRTSLMKLAVITCLLPLIAFIFCVVWSITFNFEETTFTHCKVLNYLPSISAAIGNHWIQYIMWCIAITLHAPGRFLFVSIYNKHYKSIINPQKHNLVKLSTILNTLENISLMGLTYFASVTFYPIHEKLFITFICSSELYMLLTCYILKYERNSPPDKRASLSLTLKIRLIFVNMACFTIAGYFFVRHNRYCEPGVYTLFALFEYIVVLSNMLFHLTAILDFKGQMVTVYGRTYEIH